MKLPENYRFSGPQLGHYQSSPGNPFGCFIVPAVDAPKRRRLRVIATDGRLDGDEDTGWEHVSVSLDCETNIPTWEEMCFVKALFWDASECVVQFHPPESDYINYRNNCLHLWRARNQPFPMPPKICV